MEETSSSSPEPSSTQAPRRPARQFALATIARRAHGENELRGKMQRSGYTDASIDAVIAFLHEYRYLDDVKFARELAEARARHRGWGPARIREKLVGLGIADAHVDEALRASFPHGEEAAARGALDRFLASERPGRPRRVRQARAYRHLLSRGFAASVAHDLVTGRDLPAPDGVESPELEEK